MDITIQVGITEALESLAMVTAAEKYVLSQITITIKQLEDTNNILT